MGGDPPPPDRAKNSKNAGGHSLGPPGRAKNLEKWGVAPPGPGPEFGKWGGHPPGRDQNLEKWPPPRAVTDARVRNGRGALRTECP